MQENLKQKTVLAMYDVRGIQNYIFSTNRIRDIIGASEVVENIILNGLKAICDANRWDENLFLLDWESDNNKSENEENNKSENKDNKKKTIAFLEDEKIQMEVIFIGGGNAHVLFRKGEICEKVNRALAKYVLENTYSLNLAVAVVEKTDNYSFDYENINNKMREIKAVMPKTKPMGAFPFMAVDTATGYPLSTKDESANEYISTEAMLKRKSLLADDSAEKILDNMVTKKGENSTLAVVHIDGNSMGNRIKEIMKEKSNYNDAIVAVRQISQKLKNEFGVCFATMCNEIDNISQQIKPSQEGKLYRKIICAGDDITFICNAKVAILAVKTFLEQVATKLMYEEGITEEEKRKKEQENKRRYAMSACAGIAFFNSHFPFSDAYETAEACCGSAKKHAKLEENRAGNDKDGMVGNFFDYQICSHVQASDLSNYREKQYTMKDGTKMIYRPYYVTASSYEGIFDLNSRNSNKDVANILLENMRIFKDEDSSRSKYKKLRNAYALGMNEVENEITFLKSRKVVLPTTEVSTWYDALELMDF